MRVSINVSPPVGMTGRDTARWVLDFKAEYEIDRAWEKELVRPRVAESPSASSVFTVDWQLERFGKYWPDRESFLRKVYEGLVGLGYEAKLPKIRPKDGKPGQWIHYIGLFGASAGARFGSSNSGAFEVVWRGAAQYLDGNPVAKKIANGWRIQFDTQEKVDLILDLARKARSADN